MRNVMARVAQKDKKAFADKMMQIWVQPDRKGALRTARIFMAEHRDRYSKAVAVLADGLEDSLQFYAFPEFDPRKIASTNVLERMFREVRRRSRVVGVFPRPSPPNTDPVAGEQSDVCLVAGETKLRSKGGDRGNTNTAHQGSMMRDQTSVVDRPENLSHGGLQRAS